MPGQLNNRRELKDIRRRLRTRATPAEAALWKLLKGRKLAGRKFRRQHSFGRYVLDFYCPAERLAVELDGAYHRDPEQADADARRDAYLLLHGVRVIRIENEALLVDAEAVLEFISSHFAPA